MQARTALIAGATGLIGRQLMELLLGDNNWDEVRVIARRAIVHEHPRLVVQETDFDGLGSLAESDPAFFDVDAIFCCLGTTMKAAGNKAAFERVDHDYVVSLARAGRAAGARCFLMISAIGADSNSPFFYNRVKGRAEEAVKSMGYNAVHIMQPSLLLGQRNESRPGEAISQKLSPLFSPLLCGPLSRYRPVQAVTVAQAMAEFAASDQSGCHVHQYDGSKFT